MTQRWRLRPHDPERIAALSAEADIPPLLAQLLLNRGISDPARARVFLDARLTSLHDPELLPGVVEAADRIVAAVRERRKIVIYGDYDVDGVCGTSVLWACLRLAGASAELVEYYIPHRVEEGYGLNAEALRKLVTERHADLIVTVDCGISAVEEARVARELGVSLIITDHHTIGPELPAADVLVHPRLPGSLYPFADLCGCGVAFKLAWQICKSFGDGKKASPHLRDFLVRSIGLVALATVADIVPLEGENRILVRHGLERIVDNPSVGLRALMEVSGFQERRQISTGNVGFGLAPRINAAGRLECALKAVEMLTTDDADSARQIAQFLNQCNSERQDLERSIADEARQMIEVEGGLGERGAIVLGKVGWHAGVIGIVASRLVETFHRPAVVVSLNDGVCQGSARSVPGFHLYDAISACSEGLTGFGGHAAAAGLKMPREVFPHFAERFDRHCRTAISPQLLQKELMIDAEVPLALLTRRLVEGIEALEPHGMGNPRPLLMTDRVRVVGEPRIVGEKKNHVQLRVEQGGEVLRVIAWNMAERAKKLTAGTLCSVAFHPAINEWNGRRDVQLELKDFQIQEGELHAPPT
ncbi:MAG TPA: single-stranded-DNA-specific exonuclease RecJ [Isosphaeraceae bacterium]|jgi:single-stranded-DNA-specific exonuclease|nr:single-stranded-DNA-specific exonuclease RecJ [Isosphaeraceae bacterium]